MRNNFFKNQSPIVEFVIIAIIIVSSFLVFTILSLLLAIPLFDLSFNDLINSLSDIENPQNINFIKYSQTIQSIGLFIAPSIVILYLYGGKFKDAAGLKEIKNPSIYGIPFLIMISLIPFINYLGELNSNFPFPQRIIDMEENAMRLTEQLLNADNLAQLAFNLFMIAIIPAIGEELLFRNIFQNYFIRITKNPHLGIFIAAFLFSALHMQFLGFLPRFLLGIAFGYMYLFTGSLLASIFAHFVNNGLAVVLLYYVGKGSISEDIETIGAQPELLPLAILSIIVTGGLFYYLKKKSLPNIE